jgi:hypothetical protein
MDEATTHAMLKGGVHLLIRGILKPRRGLASDRQGQLVMATPQVLDKGMAGDHDLALRSCLRPRIGPSLDLRRPWSASMCLLA